MVLAEGLSPTVILMDNQMPVMDGAAATRALRQGGFEGVIIGMTGAPSALRRRCPPPEHSADRMRMPRVACPRCPRRLAARRALTPRHSRSVRPAARRPRVWPQATRRAAPSAASLRRAG